MTIMMMATDDFYDSNFNPRHVRKGHVFAVNDDVQAKDYEKLAVRHEGTAQPAKPDPVVPAGTITGVARKAREVPLNKMNPPPPNKTA